MIHLEKKIIYLHIPKTGGASVETVLLSLGFVLLKDTGFVKANYVDELVENTSQYNTEKLKSIPYEDQNNHIPLFMWKVYLERHGYDLKDFKIFATVRDPYKLVISGMNFYKKLNYRPILIDFSKSHSDNIKKFIDIPLYHFDWMCFDGVSVNDNVHIVFTENISEQLYPYLSQFFECNPSTSNVWINRTKKVDYTDYYRQDKDLEPLVSCHFKYEIDRFGFEKPN